MFNQVSPDDQRKLADLKEVVVSNFKNGDWIELGLKTGSADVVRGHSRLLRSLGWGDEDYAGHALDVLVSIIARDPNNMKIIEDFVDDKFGEAPGENISTSPSRNPKITFAPSVFEVPESPQDPALVAVMMPFAPEFEPVFKTIESAAMRAGLKCLRVKDIWEHSTIIQDVFSLIFRSRIVVCDFSGRNPNVFYEAGIAHTLGKNVVPITQSGTDIPFDLQHHRYLTYLNNGEGLLTLRAALSSRLSELAPDLNPWLQS
jgi:hypothetical protein